ncbi:LytR C-terminal domain-containing protein, partial [Streptomyces sp. TRM76130]|nr:LytR C-terminal domain-containing protein [Streptomyces sp. TRM76130]
AEQLFRLVREDKSLEADTDEDEEQGTGSPAPTAPAAAADDEIAVLVQNGTDTDTEAPIRERAAAVAQLLVGKGFTRAATDSSVTLSEDETLVRYPSADMKADAERVAAALGIPARSVQRSTDVSGVTLVVGADWLSGAEYTAQDGDSVPESADSLNGSDTSACMTVNPDYTW